MRVIPNRTDDEGPPARLLRQREQRQHSAGAALFCAIGIVAIQIAGRAHATIMHVRHTLIPTRANDVGGEINFVVRRTNAGAELDHEVARSGSKFGVHPVNRVRDDAELCSLLPGMDQSDRASDRIDEVNGATIRHVDAETDTALVRHQTIASIETFVGSHRRVDHADAIIVNLLRRDEGHSCDAIESPHFSMNLIEPLECFRFFVRDIDSRDTRGEAVHETG